MEQAQNDLKESPTSIQEVIDGVKKNPFLKLGNGIHSYFWIQLCVLKVMGIFTIFAIAQMFIMSSFDGLGFLKEQL